MLNVQSFGKSAPKRRLWTAVASVATLSTHRRHSMERVQLKLDAIVVGRAATIRGAGNFRGVGMPSATWRRTRPAAVLLLALNSNHHSQSSAQTAHARSGQRRRIAARGRGSSPIPLPARPTVPLRLSNWAVQGRSWPSSMGTVSALSHTKCPPEARGCSRLRRYRS